MNESFELLSSMSPKLKGRQKTLKKAITILALKKNIRRSSIYDKASAFDNKDLAVVEVSTGSSESSSYFQRDVDKKEGKNNVIIIDSTDSEDNEYPPRPVSKKLSSELLKSCRKNEVKVDRIQEWLNNIELDEKKDNLTFFSQVSTIYGDEAHKFDPDGLAACSTFNERLTRRFDELFIPNKNGLKNKPLDDFISDDSFSNEINTSLGSKLKQRPQENFDSSNYSADFKQVTNDFKGLDVKNVVIDETLLTSDESIVKPAENFNSPKLSLNTPEQLLKIRGDFVTSRKKNVRIIQEAKNNSQGDSLEMETMLDSLYGVKWREKQYHVLPLSEPKKKRAINHKKILAPNTERVMKLSNKENLLNGCNPATEKLNFDKLKTPRASPWMQRLKGLVDSDSDGNTENTNERTKGMERVKTKLNFLETSPITKINNIQATDKAIESNKESYLGESLEERIKRKMINFEVPPKSSKNINKKGGSNKENSPDKGDKGKIKRKGLQNEIKGKPLSENDNRKTTSTKGINKKFLKSETEEAKRSKSTSTSDSFSEIEISSDEEYDNEITRMYEVKRKSMMPLKEGSYSFLESLSAHIPLNKCDMTARIFRTSFKHYRDELKKKLFSLYNEKVFDNAIPSDTELEWNDKLRNTAGMCYCKKITHRDGKVVRKVKIGLSSKVLDSADRLRDTLIHEMCHAGTWVINQISNGHGVYWKNWAFKAMRAFPELPPIKRCHSYQINTKYTYKCTGCGYSFGRHSKSVDTERKCCGHCRGKFELLLNKKSKSGETKSVPVTPRKEATGFALFVKENYARYKEPAKKHGDVMKILGQKFSELKLKKTD